MISRLTFSISVLGALAVAGGVYTLAEFGAEGLWPGLVTNFAASLLAFILALEWERSRARSAAQDAAQIYEKRQANSIEQERERRRAEIIKRLYTLSDELGWNLESVEMLKGGFAAATDSQFTYLNPQLLDGSWHANATRLAQLFDNVTLIAALAKTYGRIEELRWRLRLRSEQRLVEMDPMIQPLVDELVDEINGLLDDIRAQVERPSAMTVLIGTAYDNVHPRAIAGQAL